MKKTLMGVMLGVLAMRVDAQDVVGTELEQLAALRVYIVTAEKGYRIAEDGIHTIRDIRQAEYGLHSMYFGSLSVVNPAVRGLAGAAETAQSEAAMLRGFAGALARWRLSGRLSAAELGYAGKLYDKLAGRGRAEATALQALLEDGALEMEDGERVSQITVILHKVRERSRMVGSFVNNIDLLVARREAEMKNMETIKQLYGPH